MVFSWKRYKPGTVTGTDRQDKFFRVAGQELILVTQLQHIQVHQAMPEALLFGWY